MSVNNRSNVYYQKRYHVRLTRDDMTKDEIFPVIDTDGDIGGPVEGFMRVYSDLEFLAYSDDERAVYIAA